jgi:hypothetical protein
VDIEIPTALPKTLGRYVSEEHTGNDVMFRLRFAHAFLAIGFVALWLAAMRGATSTVAATVLYTTYGILVAGSVGAMVNRRRRESWVGFALLGWAYFLPVFVFGSEELVQNLPTSRVLYLYIDSAATKPAAPPGFGVTWLEREWPRVSYSHTGRIAPPKYFTESLAHYNSIVDNSIRIGHLFITLTFAVIGYVTCTFISLGRHTSPPTSQSPRGTASHSGV